MPPDAPIFCRFTGKPCTNEDCRPGKQPGKPEVTTLPRCEYDLITLLDETLNSTPAGDRTQVLNRLELSEFALGIPSGKMVEVFNSTLQTIRNHRNILEEWARM